MSYYFGRRPPCPVPLDPSLLNDPIIFNCDAFLNFQPLFRCEFLHCVVALSLPDLSSLFYYRHNEIIDYDASATPLPLFRADVSFRDQDLFFKVVAYIIREHFMERIVPELIMKKSWEEAMLSRGKIRESRMYLMNTGMIIVSIDGDEEKKMDKMYRTGEVCRRWRVEVIPDVSYESMCRNRKRGEEIHRTMIGVKLPKGDCGRVGGIERIIEDGIRGRVLDASINTRFFYPLVCFPVANPPYNTPSSYAIPLYSFRRVPSL